MNRIEHQARGTQIIIGDDYELFGEIISIMALYAVNIIGAEGIRLPIIDGEEGYAGTPGEMMRVTGPSRPTILRPECTSQVRRFAQDNKNKPMVLYYIERCFRLERPQANRYREFTQFGVEWIWPDHSVTLESVAQRASQMLTLVGVRNYDLSLNVDRGSHYYRNDETFEIRAPELGAQDQVCGGGRYDEGIGFAFGVERVIAALGETE